MKYDVIAINDEADVQDLPENGNEVAGLEQPIDISDDVWVRIFISLSFKTCTVTMEWVIMVV